MRSGAVVSLLLLSSALAAGQTLGFRFLATEDGLPQLSVTAIAQDHHGLLWAGTQDGLARFDGVRFRTFGVSDGLVNDHVTALAASDDALWIATRGGLSVRRGERFETLVALPPEMAFTHLAVAGSLVWCGGPSGLASWDGTRLLTERALEGATVSALVVDAESTVWVASTAGLFQHRDGKTLAVPWAREPLDALAIDGEGRLAWVTHEGVLEIVDRSGVPRSRTDLPPWWPDPEVRALLVDRRGVFWIGGLGGLIRVTDGKPEVIDQARGFPYFELLALYEDRDGFVWIGAYGTLAQLTGVAFDRYGTAQGLGADSVRPVLRDTRGVLWAGTANGLSRFDGQRFQTFTTADGLESKVVRALAASPGALWVGTARGVSLSEGERFKPAKGLPPVSVRSLAAAADGSLWVVTETEGLFHGTDGAFAHVEVPGVTVARRVLCDERGRVWVSGVGGLARFDGAWKHWGLLDGLASSEVVALAVDGAGVAWFGYADGGGLTRFDGQTFRTWSTADGLSHNSVFSLGADAKGQLWVGTARGVDRFDGTHFRNYGRREGYPSAESNGNGFWRDADGSLWFGTAEGLAHYFPEQDSALDAAPTVALRGVELTAAADGKAGEKTLTAEVVVPSFINPGQLEVQYRLGLEAWRALEERTLRLERVPPGAWVLEVRARRYQGPWSTSVQSAFRIEPPYWTTWWFITAMGLCVLGVVSGLVTLRLRGARREALQLERLVSLRTSALERTLGELSTTKSHLEAANVELSAASRLKSAFLANMSHEIRTPMNAVVGMSSLLDGTRLDGEQREYVDTIRGSADLLLGLLNDVLDLSKIEAGKLVLEEVDFELRPLLEDVAQQLAGAAAQKQLELAVVVGRSVPRSVRGDPTRLRQVVLNLVSNAVKFTEQGEVVVRASTGSGRLRVEVRDTGIGIEADAHGALFSVFTQADASTTRRFGGTGLGLSICRALVQALGGEVGVTSTPGAGSTFWFELPLLEGATVTATPLAGRRVAVVHAHRPTRDSLEESLAWLGASVVPEGEAEVVLADVPGAGVPRVLLTKFGLRGRGGDALAQGFVGFVSMPTRVGAVLSCVLRALGASADLERDASPLGRERFVGRRVLVAEDNPVNQRVVVRMLEKLGLQADLTSDGAQALEAMGRQPYDLVLMDCQMPVLDGYAAARAIRALPGKQAKVPIVAVTASALDDERTRCLEAGIDDYLAKPLRLSDLEQMLAAWL